MLVAIVVLFVLYLSNSPKENSVQKHLSNMSEAQNTQRKENKPTKILDEENRDCPHSFGYLRSRKEKGVPEECIGCFELVKCMLGEDYCVSSTAQRTRTRKSHSEA